MKKVMLISIVFVFVLFGMSGVFAGACDLDISMINQDPYPAIPGDYVKIVFQIDGVDNPECGLVEFELLEQYPLIFDPEGVRTYTVDAGLYDKDYSSYLLAHYKVRIDNDALDGDNPIEVQSSFGNNVGAETKQFNLNVEDTRADFKIFVKNYDYTTRIITFEILNIAEVDVEALTLEISKQDSIEIKGSKTKNLGDLDSNEYTTADFEAIPFEGEIKILIEYSDKINLRRTIEKSVFYEPEYFEDRASDEQVRGFSSYLIWIVVVGVIGYYLYSRWKKKKDLQKKLNKK